MNDLRKSKSDQKRSSQNFQTNLRQSLQDPSYGQFDYEYNQNQQENQMNQSQRSKGSFRSKKSNISSTSNLDSLPISEYEVNKIKVQVHTDKETQDETVVIIKRTVKSFIYHSDNFYRDKGSKRNNYVNDEVPNDQNLKKFWKNRYYLFSKFDRGIKIDDESWYSITPETVAKHVASRVVDVYGEGNANAMDGFCGVGGNLIQLARKCGFTVGNDFDPIKLENAMHNSGIYNVQQKIQFINKDFLQLKIDDIKYPADSSSKIDVIYISPPWGGVGYNLLDEYKLEYLYPDFREVLKKALDFSRNLVMFLPRNTSINEIIEYLSPLSNRFQDDPTNPKNELAIEIEQIMYGNSCKGIHIYTGDLAKIDHKEIAEYFYQNYCSVQQQSDENYLKIILHNIFQLCGYRHFIKYFKKDPANCPKISLSKVIKKIQTKFSEEEWNFLKKYHKRSRTNSKKSSTMSHVSMEEAKSHTFSETSSVASAKKSTSSMQKRLSKAEKLARKYAEKYEGIEDDEKMDEDFNLKEGNMKKVVHFGHIGEAQDHIELKDLSQKDFLDLIGAKNQDKRFYGWLHHDQSNYQDVNYTFKADPLQDIEYFRQLYDNNLFNSNTDNFINDLKQGESKQDDDMINH